jgi:hypothetical protein
MKEKELIIIISGTYTTYCIVLYCIVFWGSTGGIQSPAVEVAQISKEVKYTTYYT